VSDFHDGVMTPSTRNDNGGMLDAYRRVVLLLSGLYVVT
jgi:hypothetical protein